MLTEFMITNPILGILLLSIVINIFVTLATKYMTDQERLKHIRGEMKKIRVEMKEARNDPQKMAEINRRSMQHSGEQFKQQFKPMLITMIPIILIFAWLRGIFAYDQIILNLPFNIWKPGVNNGFGWFGVYFLSTAIFSILFKKLFKVH